MRPALRGFQFGIEVLPGAGMPEGLKPGKMIQTAGIPLHIRHIHFQQPRDLGFAHEHPVAQSDDLHLTAAGEHFTDFGERVGVVEHPRARTAARHGIGNFQHRSKIAQGVEQPAGTAVFAVNLPETVFARDVEILRPVKIAVDFDGGDDKIRPVQGLRQIGGVGNAQLALQPPGHLLGVTLLRRQFRPVAVHQRQVQVALRQGLAQQHIADTCRAKFAAAGAHQGDFQFHVFSVSIQVIPSFHALRGTQTQRCAFVYLIEMKRFILPPVTLLTGRSAAPPTTRRQSQAATRFPISTSPWQYSQSPADWHR